jgi:hypothetical protein
MADFKLPRPKVCALTRIPSKALYPVVTLSNTLKETHKNVTMFVCDRAVAKLICKSEQDVDHEVGYTRGSYPRAPNFQTLEHFGGKTSLSDYMHEIDSYFLRRRVIQFSLVLLADDAGGSVPVPIKCYNDDFLDFIRSQLCLDENDSVQMFTVHEDLRHDEQIIMYTTAVPKKLNVELNTRASSLLAHCRYTQSLGLVIKEAIQGPVFLMRKTMRGYPLGLSVDDLSKYFGKCAPPKPRQPRKRQIVEVIGGGGEVGVGIVAELDDAIEATPAPPQPPEKPPEPPKKKRKLSTEKGKEPAEEKPKKKKKPEAYESPKKAVEKPKKKRKPAEEKPAEEKPKPKGPLWNEVVKAREQEAKKKEKAKALEKEIADKKLPESPYPATEDSFQVIRVNTREDFAIDVSTVSKKNWTAGVNIQIGLPETAQAAMMPLQDLIAEQRGRLQLKDTISLFYNDKVDVQNDPLLSAPNVMINHALDQLRLRPDMKNKVPNIQILGPCVLLKLRTIDGKTAPVTYSLADFCRDFCVEETTKP